MQNFTVFVDELTDTTRPSAPQSFMIALIPSSRGNGAMSTKYYSTDAELARDLHQRLSYTQSAVMRFFASEDKHHTLLNHPLADEDAEYLGWLAD